MSEATAVIAPVRNSFPSPYEQPAPAGAEGWKDLYAYNLVFQENRRELEEGKFIAKKPLAGPSGYFIARGLDFADLLLKG